MCYKCYQGQINAIYLFTFFKCQTHFSSICLILSPYFLSVLLSLFTTSSHRCERTFLSSISWSMNDKCRWIAASYSCRWIASLCFASFSISFACRSVNSRCWFCTGERTECGEKDFFFSWKKKIRVIPTGVEPLTFWLLQWNLDITKCQKTKKMSSL